MKLDGLIPMKPDICIAGLLPEELSDVLAQEGREAYRARQVLEWVFRKGVLDFGGMTDLSCSVRKECAARLRVVCLEIVTRAISSVDTTEKFLLRTDSGESVEAVYIPSGARRTVCLSTQMGCPVGCAFCASGARGCQGNLTAGEIVSQVLLVMAGRPNPKPTNIVFMGMGEPFLNYAATVKAARILNHAQCLGVAARKITISTCGLPDEIRRFSTEGLQAELSISLHAADDQLRSRLVPINKQYPLSGLMSAAREYVQRTHRIITFEYVMLKGVNDSVAHAQKLARLLRGLACKVNLIPFNAVANSQFQPSTSAGGRVFQQTLERLGIAVTLRRSRGEDINGACGQLRCTLAEAV